MSYDWFRDLKTLVEWELDANWGTDTPFPKPYLTEWFKKLYPDKPYSKLTKSDMIRDILKKENWYDIYNKFKDSNFGIKPYHWKQKYNLTDYQMKKMVKCKFLLFPSYKKTEKILPGTYVSVQYYEAEPFFNVTVEEVEEWKANNIRGYIKREEI